MNLKPNTCFKIALILLCHVVSSIICKDELTYLTLDSGMELDINSSNLRLGLGYRIFAPYNHKIKLKCSYMKQDDDGITNSTNGNGEFLHVQTDFTHNDSGGQSIYVSANFTKISMFNHIIIGLRYVNDSGSGLSEEARGHFQCHVTVVKAKRCECGWGRQVC